MSWFGGLVLAECGIDVLSIRLEEIRRPDFGGSGHRVFAFRLELLATRIHDQMQLAGIEAGLRLVMPDIDDADFSQFVREERPDALARSRVENVERVVHHDPARPLQDDPGKGEALLLVVGQFPVPSIHLVEVRLEVLKSNAGERIDDSRMLKGIGRVRVSDDLAEGTGRDIGSHRHEHDRVARRVRDLAASPRPKPADGAKQQGFFFAIFAGDQDTFAWRRCPYAASLSMTQPAGEAT